ncbi:MAG: N-acetylmuramoyl-L-alanine amidase [Nitrospirae bacterium]|nr:N-acetylmuramoyl-L-alanine amidase [Nitrospirota bacterium]
MKTLLLMIVALLSAVPLFAEDPGSVSLRYGRQDNAVRVVLEAGDEFIKKSSIATTNQAVVIEFPETFQLKKQQDFMFETSQKDRVLTIVLKDVTDVSSYKLTSPSRIVVDLKTVQKPSKGPQARPEAKPKLDTPQPAPLKTQPQAAQAPGKTPRSRTVVLDAGHGGHDNGMVNKDIKEKDLNLGIAKDLSAALVKKGLTVHLTRKADQAVSLIDRIIFSSGKKPDVFISFHAAPADSFSVYCAATDDPGADPVIRAYSIAARQAKHLDKSRALSKAVAASLGREFKTTVMTRQLPLPVLTSSDAPSVLIEYPMTGKYAYDRKMLERLVKALVQGFEAYEQ